MQDEKTAELHRCLIDETDNQKRAKIHLELGELALKEGRIPQATRHFKEAICMDGQLDAAKLALARLGDWVNPPKRGLLGFLMGR
jgi:Tfp pilus assembly protein PilF